MAYKIKLIKKQLVATDTMAFYFTKPEAFSYEAGQYVNITLINPPETDDEGNGRNFSLASAPFEPDLVIATRLRNTAFKRVLQNLPTESELELDGLYGSFSLPKNQSAPAVLIAGGIGCTFARSMVMQATHDQLQQDITLFYADHTPQNAAFLDEFIIQTAQNKHFTFIPSMTDDPKWSGERGIITIDMIKKYSGDVTLPVYYLSGPGAMVNASRKMLLNAGVNKFNIRIDNFIGY